MSVVCVLESPGVWLTRLAGRLALESTQQATLGVEQPSLIRLQEVPNQQIKQYFSVIPTSPTVANALTSCCNNDTQHTVVALTLLDLKRRGYIGDLHLCGVNGKKVLTGSFVLVSHMPHRFLLPDICNLRPRTCFWPAACHSIPHGARHWQGVQWLQV